MKFSTFFPRERSGSREKLWEKTHFFPPLFSSKNRGRPVRRGRPTPEGRQGRLLQLVLLCDKRRSGSLVDRPCLGADRGRLGARVRAPGRGRGAGAGRLRNRVLQGGLRRSETAARCVKFGVYCDGALILWRQQRKRHRRQRNSQEQLRRQQQGQRQERRRRRRSPCQGPRRGPVPGQAEAQAESRTRGAAAAGGRGCRAAATQDATGGTGAAAASSGFCCRRRRLSFLPRFFEFL